MFLFSCTIFNNRERLTFLVVSSRIILLVASHLKLRFLSRPISVVPVSYRHRRFFTSDQVVQFFRRLIIFSFRTPFNWCITCYKGYISCCLRHKPVTMHTPWYIADVIHNWVGCRWVNDNNCSSTSSTGASV